MLEQFLKDSTLGAHRDAPQVREVVGLYGFFAEEIRNLMLELVRLFLSPCRIRWVFEHQHGVYRAFIAC